MQLITKDTSRFGQVLAFAIVETAVVLALLTFWLGRNDPMTRQQSILMMVGLVSNLVGLGSGILVGGSGKEQQINTPSPATINSSTSETVTTEDAQQGK